ncbi:MAG: pyrroline-5-carboxylate reductase [Tannerellaceae bacterium]|nr:pyrroline-5-carboxylate reductase [Tannerellaceae bacterium]
MKVTIIGAGNMGGAIARGLAKGSKIEEKDITCADLSDQTLAGLKKEYPAITVTKDNREAVRDADIVIIAVKPWLVEAVADQIKRVLDYSGQMVACIAAGVTFEQLSAYLVKKNDFENELPALFRVMPNTAIEVLNSMTFIAASNASEEQKNTVLDIFSELGLALLIEEKMMSAGTSLASCGIAFAMRYIRAAMVGGVELGFYPEEARRIVCQTVKGAVELLEKNGSNPETEIDKVTTPGGITIKGLNEMEHAGFTSSVIRGLKASK